MANKELIYKNIKTEGVFSPNIFKQYIPETKFSPFYGKSPNSAICVMRVPKHSGGGVKITLFNTFESQSMTLNEAITGHENELSAEYAFIGTEDSKIAVVEKGFPIVGDEMPILAGISPEEVLMDQARRNLDRDILKALSENILPKAKLTGDAAYTHKFVGTEKGDVFPRYLNVDLAEPNIATFNPLLDLHYKLSSGVVEAIVKSGDADIDYYENATPKNLPVMPIRFYRRDSWLVEEYSLLIGMEAYLKLSAFDLFNKHFFSPTPGSINNIAGARYKGMINGIGIYLVPELDLYDYTSSKISRAVILGGQGAALAWTRDPMIVKQVTEYGTIRGTALLECRGVEAIARNAVFHGMKYNDKNKTAATQVDGKDIPVRMPVGVVQVIFKLE